MNPFPGQVRPAQIGRQTLAPDAAQPFSPGWVMRTFPGQPESVTECRELARAMTSNEAQAQAAELCVSELVTNALVHSRSGLPGGAVILRLGITSDGAVRIEVVDDGARDIAPVRDITGLPGAAESGYGLDIVAAVATDWGVELSGDGSVTWCTIAADEKRRTRQ